MQNVMILSNSDETHDQINCKTHCYTRYEYFYSWHE